MGEKEIGIETFEHHGKRNRKTSRANFYMNHGIDILPAKKGGYSEWNGANEIERENKASCNRGTRLWPCHRMLLASHLIMFGRRIYSGISTVCHGDSVHTRIPLRRIRLRLSRRRRRMMLIGNRLTRVIDRYLC
jgi:hypothetical protein